MSLKPVFSDLVIPLVTGRVAGTYASGPISQPGEANWLQFYIIVTAVSGSTQTIDAVLQTSDDNTSYSSLTTTASAITQISSPTPPVQAFGYGYIANHEYGQVLVTIAGTGTPTATLAVYAFVI
jgi:hypothetical protein